MQHVFWDLDGRHIVQVEFAVCPLRRTGQRLVNFNVEGTNWPKTILFAHLCVLLLHDHRREVVEILVRSTRRHLAVGAAGFKAVVVEGSHHMR